jgi:hypothetical protein
MKKLIAIAIGGVAVLAVAAILAAVGYRQGWFSRIGLNPPAGSGGGSVAAGQEAGAGSPASPDGAGGPATQAAAHQFDGNVAALEWGGKVESLTGMESYSASDVDWVSNLIDGDEGTIWHTLGEVHGPTEIVLSFAEHDSVRIGEVRIFPTPAGYPVTLKYGYRTADPRTASHAWPP